MVGAFTRSIKLPAIALGLLVLSSVLIGGVWPLVLQQVVVNPNGINREPEYIARNIDATRTAYQIRDDQINYVDYPGQLTGDPAAIVNGQDTGAERPAAGPERAVADLHPAAAAAELLRLPRPAVDGPVHRSTERPRTTWSPCAS